MDVVVRADGGPEIGYGHLVRSGALAAEFLRDGHVVRYATTTPDHARQACPEGVEVRELDPEGEHDELLNRLDDGPPSLVVTDSYRVDADYQREIRDRTSLAVVIDDARHAVCADVAINGNLYAGSLTYDWIAPEPRWCLGPEHLLLRREVRRLAERGPPWRDRPERLLVTMGGSDIMDTTPLVLRALDDLPLTVDVVVGPGVDDDRAIRAAADSIETRTEIHVAPDDFLGLVYEADLAVSACGTTSYELLALGTPFVGLVQAPNQRRVADGLREWEAALVVDDPTEPASVRDGVSELTEGDRRRRYRDRGRELVDAKGAERVYRSLLDVCRTESA